MLIVVVAATEFKVEMTKYPIFHQEKENFVESLTFAFFADELFCKQKQSRILLKSLSAGNRPIRKRKR